MCFSNPSLMLLPSASLISGFAESSLMGKSIVMIQLAISVLGFAIVIGKLIELKSITVAGRNFLRNFLQGRDVLDYYLSRRQGGKVTLERIYDSTCCEELYQLALRMAEQAGLGQYFMGAAQKARFVGHGTGLVINELPVIGARSRQKLQARMCIALEPKFVLPGIGAVGIEDTLMVTDQGMVNLTACPQQIIEL